MEFLLYDLSYSKKPSLVQTPIINYIYAWHINCNTMNMNDSVRLGSNNYSSMPKEMVRKGIHMTIAFIPTLAMISLNLTVLILVLGASFYFFVESLRAKGIYVAGYISSISAIASRDRDQGITIGPITLALGALLVLVSFNPVAASCGIYALAFGDGLSSITGKLWGSKKIPFTGGKSFVGSITCFTMILSTCYGVTGSLTKALGAAFLGTIVELIPVNDLDNLLIPIVVALVVSI